jgi:hypothetical protein
MIKKMTSRPFRMTRIQKSHHVAAVGKSKVKQRLGWSSKNLSSSHIPLSRGVKSDATHITTLSIHGNPVFPITMRKLPNRRGSTAYWKDCIESGVSVYPRSLSKDAEVKNPLYPLLKVIHHTVS